MIHLQHTNGAEGNRRVQHQLMRHQVGEVSKGCSRGSRVSLQATANKEGGGGGGVLGLSWQT